MKPIERYAIFNLSGAYDFICTALKQELPVIEPYREMLTEIAKQMEEMFRGLVMHSGDKEIQKVLKAADEYTYQVVRKSIARGNPHYAVCDLKAQEYIINEAVKYVCMGCDKTKPQASQCKFRKAIETEGMMATSSLYDNCPFNL